LVCDWDRPKEPRIRWGADAPIKGAIWQAKGLDQDMSGSRYTQSDSAEGRIGTVQMPIGPWGVIDGVHIGTTWQIRLNHPCGGDAVILTIVIFNGKVTAI